MKIGSLVFATEQGLGILARSFYDAGVVTDVMIIAHGRRQEFPEWFPGAVRITALRDPAQRNLIQQFVASMDAMFYFETPFVWDAFDWGRAAGRKSFLMPMVECMPDPLPVKPDYLICPSLLDLQWAEKHCPGIPATYTPVPVKVPFRQRQRAEVFVHNAGHGGLRGRNGTAELLTAWAMVKSPAKLIVRSQEGSFPNPSVRGREGYFTRDTRTYRYDELWANGGEGDVFIFPEKHNGLSLPLQEARAAGMLVMTTDRFPNNTYLPRLSYDKPCSANPLIPVAETRKARLAPRCVEYDEAIIDPKAIALKIDEFYGRDISAYSASGAVWAAENSWENLKPLYQEVLRC
jgi:hypothetical protein